MFKVNKKTVERHLLRSGVFIVNFEHVNAGLAQPAVTCSKLTKETLEQGVALSYFTPCFSSSVVNSKQINTGWGISV